MEFKSGFRLHVLFAPLSLILLAATACRFTADSAGQDPTEIGFLPLTAVASVTPPQPERQACAVPTSEAELPQTTDLAAAPRQVRSFLNSGGDPGDLTEAYASIEWARPDLDGDGWVDLVYVLREADPTPTPRLPGTLLVYHCQRDHYELVFTAASRPDLGAPQIHSSDDLNADGRDELLISRAACGAHTCTAEVQVLVWAEGTLENRLEGAADELPSPEIEVRSVAEGPAQIAVTAQGVNSVGAGPFRPVTQLWTWDPEFHQFQRAARETQPTNYRIHLLHDADQAAQEGEHTVALGRYQRVIIDDTLQDWLNPDDERRVLTGYARFRQVVSALVAQSPEGAADYLESLRQAVASGEAAAPFLDMAETFWSGYQLTGEVGFACQEAQAYAAAHRADVLDPLYFGYTNPNYTPQDICPFTGENSP